MSYIQRVLRPGENIRIMGRLHWIIFVPGVLLLLAALVLIVLAERAQGGWNLWLSITAILAVLGILQLLWAWFVRWMTEIAVTDRRVIYKFGFVFRTTNEMHMDKVESVRVEQSILGRILNYGSITVLGTGEGFDTLKNIAAPIELRNHITGA